MFFDYLPYIQLILAFILTVLIITQGGNSGAGGAFGGSDSSEITTKKRGPELFIFVFTIVIAIAFVISVVSSIFI